MDRGLHMFLFLEQGKDSQDPLGSPSGHREPAYAVSADRIEIEYAGFERGGSVVTSLRGGSSEKIRSDIARIRSYWEPCPPSARRLLPSEKHRCLQSRVFRACLPTLGSTLRRSTQKLPRLRIRLVVWMLYGYFCGPSDLTLVRRSDCSPQEVRTSRDTAGLQVHGRGPVVPDRVLSATGSDVIPGRGLTGRLVSVASSSESRRSNVGVAASRPPATLRAASFPGLPQLPAGGAF